MKNKKRKSSNSGYIKQLEISNNLIVTIACPNCKIQNTYRIFDIFKDYQFYIECIYCGCECSVLYEPPKFDTCVVFKGNKKLRNKCKGYYRLHKKGV